MLVFHKIILFLFLWLEKSVADISISKPANNQTFAASDDAVHVTVSWIESNTVPLLETIEQYVFTLCSGPNHHIEPLTTLGKLKASEIIDHTVTLPIETSVGANGYYYIQIFAVGSTGHTIHYTPRFHAMGMTGSFEPVAKDDFATPPPFQIYLE